MSHPTEVFSESGDEIKPGELADLLCDLRYDAMADYLSAIAERLQKDSEGDGGRGRGKLAERLQSAALNLDEAVTDILKCWKICEPYMRE